MSVLERPGQRNNGWCIVQGDLSFRQFDFCSTWFVMIAGEVYLYVSHTAVESGNCRGCVWTTWKSLATEDALKGMRPKTNV